jgi:plastocyanin
MRPSLICVALCIALASGPARAAGVMFEVVDQDGHPVPNAVVALSAKGEGSESPGQQIIIDQRNEMFIPLVSVLHTGGSVVFKNSDRVRHHVYSFSAIKQFQFILNPGDSSEAIKFDKTGVAAIGCNIHDKMVTYVYVTNTKWTALTGADGSGVIASLPKGEYTVSIWHPQLKPGAAPTTQKVTVGSEPVSVSLTVSLVGETPMHGHHGSSY